VREAGALCGDPARVVVAGDSAGGNLAAVVSQLARDAGGPCPAAQLLIYPATDLSTKRASVKLFSSGFFLTERDMDWYKDHYAPDHSQWRDPRMSPLLTEDPRGLPPAIVATAGFDVLRDEGEEYARRLQQAGVRVELRRVAGQIHGFANATGVSPSARTAMTAVARSLRALIAV
jgi:acetyl esterase